MSSSLPSASAALPTLVPMRPMLLLTGFLGAGKTTLLRSVLTELASRDYLCDVILNDRENAAIDQEALRDSSDSVEALTGSCVCCEGMDELYDMVMKFSKSENHALLVELNGTADPLPLLEGFTLLEPKFKMHPRWQVCVVDARHFGKRTQYAGLEKLQLETASHYFLSHTNALSEDEERELETIVESINSHASRISAFALADALSQVIAKNKRHSIAMPQQSGKSGSALEFKDSVEIHEHHHLAHEFTGCNIVIPEPVEKAKVLDWLERLPETVIRAKALVNLSEEPDMRYLYERVGMEIGPRPFPIRSVSKAPCSGIFIGADLDPEEILKFTRNALHPDCHFPTP